MKGGMGGGKTKGPTLDGIFRTFCFREFWKSLAVEVRKFFRKKQNFRTRVIFEKKFGKKFGNLSSQKSSEKSSEIIRKCM